MKILFFEDNITSLPNDIFLRMLKKEIPNVFISLASSVKRFEILANTKKFDMFILDLMAPDQLFSFENDEPIRSTDIGLELARRIRKGYYLNQNKNSLIIIRTARADELYIQEILGKLKVNAIMSPGSDDLDIIKKLKLKSLSNFLD